MLAGAIPFAVVLRCTQKLLQYAKNVAVAKKRTYNASPETEVVQDAVLKGDKSCRMLWDFHWCGSCDAPRSHPTPIRSAGLFWFFPSHQSLRDVRGMEMASVMVLQDGTDAKVSGFDRWGRLDLGYLYTTSSHVGYNLYTMLQV